MKTLVLFGLILIAAIISTSAAKNDPAIAVSIVTPVHDKQRFIISSENNPHFHVIITNTSKKPQRILSESCSWGYEALYFELTDANGKTWTVKKKPKDWYRNVLEYNTLPENENMVLDIYYKDTNIWEGFPLPKEFAAPEIITMRAIFEIKPGTVPKKYSVWTGRSVSKANKYEF